MSPTEESPSELTRDSLEQFVEEKSKIIEENPDLNEEEMKAAIITDLISLLGWEIPQDGRMEYQFGDHNTNVVDYAFFHEGSSKLFLEAKAPGTPLDGHRSQIKEYLALDNVELGVLTNGKVYEIYRTYVVDDEHVERQQVDRIELAEFPDKLPVLNSLTKAEVTSGSYRDQLQRVIDIRSAREALAANEQQLASDIVTLVSETVGTIAQEPARQHVSDYLDSINGELASTGETGTDEPEPEPPTQPEIEMVDDIIIDSLREEPVFPVKSLADLPGNADAKVGVYACDFGRGYPSSLNTTPGGSSASTQNPSTSPSILIVHISKSNSSDALMRLSRKTSSSPLTPLIETLMKWPTKRRPSCLTNCINTKIQSRLVTIHIGCRD